MQQQKYDPIRGPGWVIHFSLPEEIRYVNEPEVITPAHINVDKQIRRKLKKK